MLNNELLIAVPTKNHPRHIMYYLSKTLDDALENNIDICIFDASENDETETIIKNKIKQGYSNLFYKKYAMDALLEDRCEDIYVDTGYKYIWLCGDGVVINIRKDIAIVSDEIKRGRDIILFGQDKKYVKTYKEYTDAVEFCKECFTATTLFGGVILRGDLVTKELFEDCKKKYLEQAVPGIYYEIFKNRKISAAYVVHNFYDYNPYKKANIAMSEGRVIYAFAQLFTETIWKMPEKYNSVKKELEKSLGHTTGLYDWGNLCAMRADGNLNLKIYMKYRKFLKIASDTKPMLYWMASICPITLAKRIALIEGRR